ncbi:MAG: Succinate-semialdehyde dehydrogenase [Acidobacteriales bacterium]|nr:Succinate-semialdehyde dehydrogenase [Terriglobales bacterium]
MPQSAIAIRKVFSTDPATGKVLREFECASSEEVAAAVDHAQSAQKLWREVSFSERISVFRRFQTELHRRKDEVAAQISLEAGKPQVEALLTEVLVVLDAASFYIRYAKSFLRPERVPHGNPALKTKRGYLLREPQGVVGIISPWNYPFSIPSCDVLAALIMGNAVVLKPSELTPSAALLLRELFNTAGLPPDIFQVVIGDGLTGAALTTATIDKLIFTGSVPTGRRIATAAAERLLSIVLELGGKDPMLVLEDADLDIASSAAVWGAFMNAGQTCLSVERCYVHRKIHDRFVELCVEKTKRLRVGRGSDPESEIGPMINQQQLNIIESHVADALAHGARVLTGGKRLPELGPNFYAPTILVDVKHNVGSNVARILIEETFGPVLPIIPFDTEEEAIALANDSDFGLSASVWTRNRPRGEAIAAKIEAGTVMVNDVITCFGISEAPHGGVKSSGLGRTHGRSGLEEMVRTKYIDAELLPSIPKVWWFGYGSEFHLQMKGFLDLLFSKNWAHRARGAAKATGALFRKGRL